MGTNAQEFGRTVEKTVDSTIGMLGRVPANFMVDVLMFKNPFERMHQEVRSALYDTLMLAPRTLGHTAKGVLSVVGKAATAPLSAPIIPIADSFGQAA